MKHTVGIWAVLPAGVALACLLPAPAAAQRKEARFQSSAVQIQAIEAEVKLPPEFEVALYENLIEEIRKTNKFKQIYRDGDKGAAGVADLVTLRARVHGFEMGSARARQVTTVAGATKIDVHVVITTRDGRAVLDRNVRGNVRFFGENLRATYNFARSVAKLVQQTFS